MDPHLLRHGRHLRQRAAGTSGQTYGGTAVNYYPSLKPVSQATAQVAAGDTSVATFRLTNWGRNTDTISLSYAVTDMTGATASGITVAFSPAGPFSPGFGGVRRTWWPRSAWARA